MTPVWWSQRCSPAGDMTAEGIRRQLGTPNLDPLAVLVRETSQNSWDARLEDRMVELTYRLSTLTPAALAQWRALLLPGPAGDAQALSASLCPGATVLTISDRGTTGLGGPLRNDIVLNNDPTERPDFVNFIRNVGEARDRIHGGGTYGFGKGCLYRLSSAQTILVDSQCVYAGHPQRRLIGALLGSAYVEGGYRYTGRHWWGVEEDHVPNPVLDSDAAHISKRLGMPGFSHGETGTDILVVAPKLLGPDGGGLSIDSAARRIAGFALWYLWPKLFDRPGGQRIALKVVSGDREIALPNVELSTRLRPFVQALKKIDAGEGRLHGRASEPRQVGWFAAAWAPLARSEPLLDEVEPFGPSAFHCARMRNVELVVDYYEGELQVAGMQYGAVFKASPDADVHFAAAEPPTHDDWVTKGLEGTSKGVVTGANTFIKRQLLALAKPDASGPRAEQVPLGKLSSELAKLLSATTGLGGGGGEGGGTGKSGGGSARTRLLTVIESPRLVIEDGVPVVSAKVRLADSDAPVVARIGSKVALDGRDEEAPPDGARQPCVLGWRSKSGEWVQGDSLRVTSTDSREWHVFVEPAPDTATSIKLSAELERHGSEAP